MPVNNFDVLKRMAAENKDIRLGTDFLGAQNTKQGTRVTMGAAGDVVTGITLGDLRACLLIFNVKQFNEIKAAMEGENVCDPAR